LGKEAQVAQAFSEGVPVLNTYCASAHVPHAVGEALFSAVGGPLPVLVTGLRDDALPASVSLIFVVLGKVPNRTLVSGAIAQTLRTTFVIEVTERNTPQRPAIRAFRPVPAK
jgi:hypothetical protein